MKTKVLKFIMLICLTTEMPCAWSGLPVLDEWENNERNNSAYIWPNECLSDTKCMVVESVFQDKQGNIKCMTSNNLIIVSCNVLVEKYGTKIEGLNIQVDLPYRPAVTANNIEYCKPDFKASSSHLCH